MADRSYRWLLVTLAVVGLAADQGTKYGMFRWLYNAGKEEDRGAFQSWVTADRWRDGGPMYVNGGRYNVVPGWFGFNADFDHTVPACDCQVLSKLQTWSAPVMPRVNHGALFGLGGSQKSTANGFFAAVSLAAAVAILVWGTRKGPRRERWLSAALGLILGGTIGNLYDRLVFGGVRDFLYFYRVEWPVFNVADCCLVVGAGLLLVQAIFVPSPAETTPADPTAAAPDAPKV
jgi:lipoprotein signal peptidase